MQGSILLYSTVLNNTITETEQSLTYASEQLIILGSEVQRLSEIWKGESQEQWVKVLLLQYQQVDLCVKEAKRHAAWIKDLAQVLTGIEQKIELLLNTL